MLGTPIFTEHPTPDLAQQHWHFDFRAAALEIQVVRVGNDVGYGRCSLGPIFWIGNVGRRETCDCSRTHLKSSTSGILLGRLSFPITKSSMVN